MITREQINAFAARPYAGAKAEIWDAYADALVEHSAALCAEFGIDQPLELQHFMAQIGHETGGFTVLWESMNYRSADRIMEIFGEGRHSARITRAEATELVGNAEALAERVYGLGNPKKARELGNREPGDGFKYRGFGPMQITGRADHERLLGGEHTAFAALRAAFAEWDEKRCSTLACNDDLKGITKRINGGYNGLDDRREMLKRAKRVWVRLPTSEPETITIAEAKQVSSKAQAADAAQKAAIAVAGTGVAVEAADTVRSVTAQIGTAQEFGTALAATAEFIRAHTGVALVMLAVAVWFFGRHIIIRVVHDYMDGRYTPSKAT